MVEYLFELGQLKSLGEPYSERKNVNPLLKTYLLDSPHYLGRTERCIFQHYLFNDVGYFYDLDGIWYYIIPGPFRIKIPLRYIYNNVDKNFEEFKTLGKIQNNIIKFIFTDYLNSNSEFEHMIAKKYNKTGLEIIGDLLNVSFPSDPMLKLFEDYKSIYDYFDDWIMVKTDKEDKNIVEYVIKKVSKGNRIETIDSSNFIDREF